MAASQNNWIPAPVRLRHPRTAVAVTGKRGLLITVDGRNDNAAGMSLYELYFGIKEFGVLGGENQGRAAVPQVYYDSAPVDERSCHRERVAGRAGPLR